MTFRPTTNAPGPLARLRRLVAVGLLIAGVMASLAVLGLAQDNQSEGQGKVPIALGGPRLATPTSVVPGSVMGEVETSALSSSAAAAVARVGEVVAAGDTAAVLSMWQRQVSSCFVGSERTGMLCAGLPGKEGTEHKIEVVDSVYAHLSLTMAQELLATLEGMPGQLVFIADWDSGKVILGFRLEKPSIDDIAVHLWLEVEPRADLPIARLTLLSSQTPLDEWRHYDRPVTELISVAPYLQVAEDELNRVPTAGAGR
jgi:hypothetical protein